MTTDEIIKGYNFEEAKSIAEDMLNYICNMKGTTGLKLYLVEGHKGATEWTLRFELPKSTPYYTKGERWYDVNHKIKSSRKKKWKCDKFGKYAFPKNKVKAKDLSDKLFNEW